jgi:hypothetical protein
MTPVRAFIAAFLAAVMVIAGAMIVARASDRAASDLIEVLLAGPGIGWPCFLAAAGAVLMGAGGVLTAFLAFIAREEEDDGPFRRRGFPKSAPLLFVILSLALVWFALRCTNAPEPAAPIPVAVEPETPPTEDIDVALEGGDPVDQRPTVFAAPTRFSWTYQNPLIRGDGTGIWVDGDRPFADDSEARALLCDKAWIAVTGSSSEEGPAARNAIRSRLRARAADNAASGWIRSHPDCAAGPLFAVDFGQHSPVSGDASGAATAYQRQVYVIARAAAPGENINEDAARAELAAFLADPSSQAQLFGGRRFLAEPYILP